MNLNGFKVVYKENVYKAVALLDMEFSEKSKPDETYKKPKFIKILIINEDGNLVELRDEAWMFQFIPIVNG